MGFCSCVYWDYKVDCCVSRAFGESKQDEFLGEMNNMFTVLGELLAVDSDVVMPTQVRSKFGGKWSI